MIDEDLRVIPRRLYIERIEDQSPALDLPIDAATLRSHCHTVSSDDTILEFYQRAAIDGWERYNDKTLLARPHRWVLNDFPRTGRYDIVLPRGKTQLVQKIEYITGGDTATLYGPSSELSPTGEDFLEDLTGDSGGVLMPLQSSSTWPTVDLDVPNGVTIYFEAGYAAGDIPNDIKETLMFVVSTLYEHRGTADIADNGVQLRVFDILSMLIGRHDEPGFA